MGKRSPILGYNHNVRYRGLVFHVQTEDSGIASPHLFTHLFHHGVIVSTRKLVYDAGSAEEAIKSLMQAQHKATLKDLRRGHFDDKIDAYLGGTPGLLPRGVEEPGERPGRPDEMELASSQDAVEGLELGGATQQVPPKVREAPSTPVGAAQTKPPGARSIPAGSARPLAERPLPPAGATGATGAAGAAGARRAPVSPASVDTTLETDAPTLDSSSEIEILLEAGDRDGSDDRNDVIAIPRRVARDTEMQPPRHDLSRPTLDVHLDDHSRPTVGRIDERVRRAAASSDGLPGAIRPSSPAIPTPALDSRRLGERPSSPAIPTPALDSRRLGERPSSPAIPTPALDSRRLGDRPSTINAAALPPARPIARPPSRQVLPPPSVSRALTAEDRGHRELDRGEAYSPPPPSASIELPPGERPGQYAQHKRASTPAPSEVGKHERAGNAPIPAGLGRPQPTGTPPAAAKPNPAPPASGSAPAPRSHAPAPPNAGQSEPVVGRAPTPSRISPPGNRSGGVVMTRPVVIVGAPAKSAGTMPRIRKAREDEGRGFGQGLISEKSLDEVILAYLSEDADDK